MSDAPATSDPAAAAAGMLPRVRRLVDDLQRHSEHRGRTAAELIRDRDASERDAEAAAETRRQELENRRLSEVAEAQETFGQRTASITEDLDRRERTIRERHAEARASLEEKAERNEETARTQLKEAVWLAETVYEASEDKPADRERVNNEGIEGRRRQIDFAIERTLARLGRSGFAMTIPPLEEPESESPSDVRDGEAPDSRTPPNEQPTSEARALLAQVADRATAVAEATESWKSVRLFGLRMLPALAVLLVGAGHRGDDRDDRFHRRRGRRGDRAGREPPGRRHRPSARPPHGQTTASGTRRRPPGGGRGRRHAAAGGGPTSPGRGVRPHRHP